VCVECVSGGGGALQGFVALLAGSSTCAGMPGSLPLPLHVLIFLPSMRVCWGGGPSLGSEVGLTHHIWAHAPGYSWPG